MTVPNWQPCSTASGSSAPVGGDDPARGQTGLSPTKATATRAAVGYCGSGTSHLPVPSAPIQRARRAKRPGRPLAFDHALYARRNVVERAINRLKQWRGLATRYEKRAVHFLAMVTLAAILLWL